MENNRFITSDIPADLCDNVISLRQLIKENIEHFMPISGLIRRCVSTEKSGLILFFMFPVVLIAQMTVQVTNVPQLTPMLDDIYIAGDFNSWDPSAAQWKLTENNGNYSITIPDLNTSTIEFKFTRGSWSTVEGGINGAYIPNRVINFANGETVNTAISGWEDLPGTHTVSENVRILDSDMLMPQLARNRRVWICLPEEYETSEEDYPVIYIHDGQNIFDQATSFSGEWEADESMLNAPLSGCVKAILVGIDNGGSHRIDEYSPWINNEYQEGGEGALYAAFIAETLKPFIDENFRTLSGREHCFTMGSSLGALISMYLVTAYNDMFSGAALLSPAFWFNEEIYSYTENTPIDEDTRFYFICGTNESSGLVGQTEQMHEMISQAGISSENNYFTTQNGGTHNEYWWSNYFPGATLHLLGCNISQNTEYKVSEILVYPNPTTDSVVVQITKGTLIRAELSDTAGRIVKSNLTIRNGVIDFTEVACGTYNLTITYSTEDESRSTSTHIIHKK